MTSEQASDIQTVIFDMDGVLIDSPQQWQLLTADFFSGYVDDWNQEKMLSVTGLNIEDMYQQLVAMRVRLSREQFLAFCDQAAREIYLQRVSLLHGVEPLLTKLKSSLKLALASAAPEQWVKMVVQRFDLDRFFTVLVTADDVQNCKPAPDIFLLAASRLEAMPKNCLVIEDSINGVVAAKAAGMQCVAITTTFPRESLHQADRVITSMGELINDLAGFRR